MLHLLDAHGQMVKAVDGPPADALYPTSLWQNGQALDDTHCFDLQSTATTLAVGIYRQDNTARLPAISPAGIRLPDDSLLIALQ